MVFNHVVRYINIYIVSNMYSIQYSHYVTMYAIEGNNEYWFVKGFL